MYYKDNTYMEINNIVRNINIRVNRTISETKAFALLICYAALIGCY